MLANLKKTARHSLIYGAGNLTAKLVGLLLLPLYARELSIADYGVLGILETTGQFLVGIIAVRIPSAMMRWATEKQEVHYQKRIYFTALVALVSVIALFNLVAFPLRETLSQLFFGREDFSVYFTLLFLSVSFEILGLLPLHLLRLRERSWVFISLTITKLIVMMGVTIYLVAFREWGVKGVVTGMLTGNLLMWVLTLPIQFRSVVPRFDMSAARGMFKYGFPLIFSTSAALLLSLGDRYIITYFHSYDDLGVYNMAYKVGSVVNVLVINSFALGFLPLAFKLSKEEGFSRFMARTATWFMAVLVVFTLVLSLFSQEVIKVMASSNPDYWKSYVLVPFIAFNFIFKGLQYIQAIVFHITKGTRYDAFVIVIGFAINMTINFILVPILNFYGAIIATGISYLIMLAVTNRYAQKMMKVPYEVRRIVTLIAISVLIIACGYLIHEMELIPRLIIKFLLLASFPVLLFATGFLYSREKQALSKIRKYWRDPNFWLDLAKGAR